LGRSLGENPVGTSRGPLKKEMQRGRALGEVGETKERAKNQEGKEEKTRQKGVSIKKKIDARVGAMKTATQKIGEKTTERTADHRNQRRGKRKRALWGGWELQLVWTMQRGAKLRRARTVPEQSWGGNPQLLARRGSAEKGNNSNEEQLHKKALQGTKNKNFFESAGEKKKKCIKATASDPQTASKLFKRKKSPGSEIIGTFAQGLSRCSQKPKNPSVVEMT